MDLRNPPARDAPTTASAGLERPKKADVARVVEDGLMCEVEVEEVEGSVDTQHKPAQDKTPEIVSPLHQAVPTVATVAAGAGAATAAPDPPDFFDLYDWFDKRSFRRFFDAWRP
jgi:hypothetical protein